MHGFEREEVKQAWLLTPGQQRVRELAKPFVSAFVKAVSDVSFAGELCPLLEDFREVLARDPVVRNDSITSAPLGKSKFSPSYLRWLKSVSIPKQRIFDPRDIRFDHVVLHGSIAGGWGKSMKPAYTGGLRWDTTMRAILTIVAGLPMYTYQMDARYYLRSGLLEGDEGNHRLLAYLLTGETALPVLEYYEEQYTPDLSLNEAFLVVERFFTRSGRLTEDEEIVYQLYTADPRQRDAEVEAVQYFATQTTEEERQLLHTFLCSYLQRARGLIHLEARSELEDLLLCLQELRWLRARTPFAKRILALRRWFNDEYPSLFESWFEKHQQGKEQ